jgi:hypothetical protein
VGKARRYQLVANLCEELEPSRRRAKCRCGNDPRATKVASASAGALLLPHNLE